MHLRTYPLKAFFRTGCFAFALCFLVNAIIPWLKSEHTDVREALLTASLLAVLAGCFAAACLTPRAVYWDDQSLKIRFLVGGEKRYSWSNLIAWFPQGNAALLLRFEDAPNILQLGYSGLDDADFKILDQFLRESFSSRKADYDLASVPMFLKPKNRD